MWSEVERVGDWIIYWPTAMAYKPRDNQDGDLVSVYVRYNRTTQTEDEITRSELPPYIQQFIEIGG